MTREELIDLYVEANPHFSGAWGELRDLLNSFADELMPSLPEGLDEAAFAYENAQWEAGIKDCGYAPQDVAAAFKSGWMARDAQIPKLPDDVDEAAYNFALHYDNGTCDGIAQDCFIAGAEYQRKQDQQLIELAEDHAMLAGMNKMKEEMMEKAFRCEIIKSRTHMPHLKPYFFSSDYGKIGDKVRVFVFPEEK